MAVTVSSPATTVDLAELRPVFSEIRTMNRAAGTVAFQPDTVLPDDFWRDVPDSPAQSRAGSTYDSSPSMPEVRAVRRTQQRMIIMKSLAGQEDAIQTERNRLIRQKFAHGIQPQDENRLRYLEWQLDQIEDARIGPELDHFERLVLLQERFASHLEKHLATSQPHTARRRQ